MRTTIRIFFLIAIIFSSCSQKKNEKTNLTREERVKKTSYRNLNYKESEVDLIKKDVRLICKQFEDKIKSGNDVLLGFKKMKNGTFEEFNEEWNSTNALKEYMNEVWRKKDFISTIAVYNSSSQNLQNGETREILVVEMEYEEFTGKWIAFFDLPLREKFYDDKFELRYFERN